MIKTEYQIWTANAQGEKVYHKCTHGTKEDALTCLEQGKKVQPHRTFVISIVTTTDNIFKPKAVEAWVVMTAGGLALTADTDKNMAERLLKGYEAGCRVVHMREVIDG